MVAGAGKEFPGSPTPANFLDIGGGASAQVMADGLDIILSESRRNGAKLPVTALIDQFYGDVQDMGGNRWDTSSLLARLERK